MNRFPSRLRQSNPFYLLSAACMLGGCQAINHSIVWSRVSTAEDIFLIVILNCYEITLIALAAYLIRQRGLIHDGAMLMVLEAFFLVDIAFVGAEAVTNNSTIGPVLDILLLLAAIVKLYYLAQIAGLAIRNGRFVAICLQLAALYIVPIFFRHFDDGYLSDGYFYAAWWGAGLLIPLSLTLSGFQSQSPPEKWKNRVVQLLCVLPWLSLAMHIGNLHWVYNVTFYAAQTAPILLGLACGIHHLSPTRFIARRDQRVMQFLLPVIALCVSASAPESSYFWFASLPKITFTPLEITLAGVYLTYVYCFLRPYAIPFIAAGVAAESAYIFGPPAREVSDWISKIWTLITNAIWTLMPKTALNAGLTAITAAFAFLGLGVLVSLRRKVPLRTTDPSEPPDSEEPLG